MRKRATIRRAGITVIGLDEIAANFSSDGIFADHRLVAIGEWIAVGVIALAGILGIAIVFTKRPVDLDDLGAVSKRWIAQNHIDST